MFFTLILAILTGGYIVVLIWMSLGLYRIERSEVDTQPFVSVVVAARNEQHNIAGLLQALTAQDYADSQFEIIIVDDESDDDTAERVRSFPDFRVRLLQTTERHRVVSPKKHAIQTGIRAAKGDIILLTDADCLPPPTWITGIVRLFSPHVGMVIGFSPAELPKLQRISDYLLAMDSLALAAVAAGTSGWGYPATCNGRNLAYRRQVYDQVGGFSRIGHFVSGDDDLMLKLVQQTEWKIRYAFKPELAVPTQMVKSVTQFAHQRLRHASKGFHYEVKKVAALIFVYLYNLCVFLSIPFALFAGLSWLVPVFALLLKAAFEWLPLFRFAQRMQRLHVLRIFPLAEMLHVPYVVLFGVLGLFVKFKWKESQIPISGKNNA